VAATRTAYGPFGIPRQQLFFRFFRPKPPNLNFPAPVFQRPALRLIGLGPLSWLALTEVCAGRERSFMVGLSGAQPQNAWPCDFSVIEL